MNERYQKSTAPAGKTRRSAASAKPSRSTGDKPKAAGKGKSQSSRVVVYHPPTPEYKRLRIIWWALIGASIVLSTGAWYIWRDPKLRDIGTYVLFAGYAFIAAAIWLDWARLRPLRQEFMKSQGKGTQGKG